MSQFLFPSRSGGQTAPPPSGWLSALRRRLSLRLSGWISLPLFPLVCLLVMDYMNFGGQPAALSAFWREHPGSALFECLVVLLLFLVALLLLRRVWPAALLFGGTSLIFAYVNYMKTALNGDHFYPQDLAMVSHAGALTSFLSGQVPRWFWPGAALVVLWIAALWLLGLALPRPFLWRWSAAVLLALAVYSLSCTPDKTRSLLSRFGMSAMDSALQASNYAANGFVGAFTLNALTMQLHPPEGYSRQAVEALLENYPAGSAGPAAEPFDVAVVLSESFFDPRILPGVSFSENPLEYYDRLLQRENCLSGTLYTTAVGGGTVRPEFGVLTGLTCDYLPDVTTPYWYVERDFPTYVSAFRDAGYTTLALHPYDKKFYARDAAYPHLGFDAFYGEEDVYGMTDVVGKRGYVADESVARVMTDLMDGRSGPVFLFTITMQNHQPFNPLPPEDIQIQVDCPALSQTSRDALTTYTQGLRDADRMLGTLAEWIDSRERPTVLVFFGDHLPTLGANHLAYNETGFVDTSDGLSPQERQKLFSTPFLIYSNRPLEGGLFSERTGNSVSDYNLLNSIFPAIGMARTPYMELLAGFYQAAPFYNIRLLLPETEAVAPFTRAMELITYDRLAGRGWSG